MGVGFFLGPIFGAILFTLLQTVIGLQTDLWALYTGIVFILMVMFLPTGLTGLFAMHLIPLQLGRFGILIKPYSKIFIPGLVFLLGTIALIELINHVRHHGEEQFMTLFWIEFDTSFSSMDIVFAYDNCRFLLIKVLLEKSQRHGAKRPILKKGDRNGS